MDAANIIDAVALRRGTYLPTALVNGPWKSIHYLFPYDQRRIWSLFRLGHPTELIQKFDTLEDH